MATKEWLMERINVSDGGCWIWKQRKYRDGYGQIPNPFRHHGFTKSHRLAWFLWHGDPGASHVLHRCDNRSCCNPEHLFLGTLQDNTADMIAKGRNWRPFPVSLVKQFSIPPSMLFMAA